MGDAGAGEEPAPGFFSALGTRRSDWGLVSFADSGQYPW